MVKNATWNFTFLKVAKRTIYTSFFDNFLLGRNPRLIDSVKDVYDRFEYDYIGRIIQKKSWQNFDFSRSERLFESKNKSNTYIGQHALYR